MTDPRRRIPGVDRLLLDEGARPLLEQFPRARVTEALRQAVEWGRDAVARGAWPYDPADVAPYLADAARRLADDALPSLRETINATGVVLHTNLGRAPLAPEACAAMARVGGGYSNLEFDLEAGTRGSRYDHCADLLTELTGAEDAVVVNNCAAALVLCLNTLAAGKGVIVSRGELVEIGGGFRIPDMLERAGAILVEVGATNRTRIEDYAAALAGTQEIGAILKVHRSNFRVSGFTSEVTIDELTLLARESGVPLVHDVGSGLLLDPARLGLPPEPRASSSISAGADLVVFSGDKLLGGPQAGVVAGRRARVKEVRTNPLCRAFRVDKGTLAALEATLRLYRDPDSVCDRIPVLRMLTVPLDELEARALAATGRINRLSGAIVAEAVPGVGRVGGGTFPDHSIPSWVVRLGGGRDSAGRVAELLRTGERPVVVRVDRDAVVIDLRTVEPADDETVAGAVVAALGAAERGDADGDGD